MPEAYSICLMNDSFPPLIDGVANAVVNYARVLTNMGDKALVVTPSYPGADDSAYPYPVVRYPSIDMRKAVGYMAGYPFSPDVAAAMKEQQVGLIHSHCPVASTVLARSLRGVVDAPLVMTYHTKFDVDIAKAVRSRMLQEGAIKVLVQNISACDEVWTVSRGAGENLRSLGYEGDWIVMENGVDMPLGKASEEAVREAVKDYDLPDGVPLFLFVGRLMWYKGIRISLEALAALKDAGRDFRMVLIGGGADEAEIKKTVEELKLSDRVFFTGPIQDREVIRAWYSRADLFLFPSTFDTNGLVVREAAAVGLASVLVRDSCAAEGVTEGESGFLISENAASMALCLDRLLEHPEKMQAVGEGAQRNLYFSWEEAVRRARERYGVVMERYRSGYYPRKDRLEDEFFRRQGEMMESMARAESQRKAAWQKITGRLDEMLDEFTGEKRESGDRDPDLGSTFWNEEDWYL